MVCDVYGARDVQVLVAETSGADVVGGRDERLPCDSGEGEGPGPSDV